MNGTTQQHRKPRTKPRTACHRNLQPHSKFLSTNDICSIFCYDSQSQPIYDSNPLPSKISLDKTQTTEFDDLSQRHVITNKISHGPRLLNLQGVTWWNSAWSVLRAKIQQMRFALGRSQLQCKLLNQNRVRERATEDPWFDPTAETSETTKKKSKPE